MNLTEQSQGALVNHGQYLSKEMTYNIWISTKIVNLVLGVAMLYILIAHLIFCLKTWKKKGKIPCKKVPNSIRVDVLIGSGLFAAFLRLFVDIEWFVTQGNKANIIICDISSIFDIVTYIYALASVQFFMWYRQRQIYSHRILRSLKPKFLGFASWTLLVSASSLSVFSLIILCMTKMVASDPVGCHIDEEETPLYKYRMFMIAVFSGVAQITLLWLALFPLYRHRHKSMQISGVTVVTLGLMRKLALTAVICVLTDVMLGAFGLYLQRLYHLAITLFNINLLINMVCIMFAYKDWKQRLFPWTKSPSKRKTLSTRTESKRKLVTTK